MYAVFILALTFEPLKVLGVRRDIFVGSVLGRFLGGSVCESLFC
jgi:hypothetical protein